MTTRSAACCTARPFRTGPIRSSKRGWSRPRRPKLGLTRYLPGATRPPTAVNHPRYQPQESPPTCARPALLSPRSSSAPINLAPMYRQPINCRLSSILSSRRLPAINAAVAGLGSVETWLGDPTTDRRSVLPRSHIGDILGDEIQVVL